MILIIKFKNIYMYTYTYSVLSTVGVVGMIISMQLTKMVVIINSENKGCTRMYIATLLIGLNGFNIHRASVAENLKISLPLLITTKVWNKNKTFVYLWKRSSCDVWSWCITLCCLVNSYNRDHPIFSQ